VGLGWVGLDRVTQNGPVDNSAGAAATVSYSWMFNGQFTPRNPTRQNCLIASYVNVHVLCVNSICLHFTATVHEGYIADPRVWAYEKLPKKRITEESEEKEGIWLDSCMM